MFVTVLLASTLGKVFQPFLDAMAWVIAAFYALIPNYAIAIALLTVAVMVVTAPLTVKSTRSMMAMSKLQPKVKELQKKYSGDKVRLNEEMMKLYRENNVSPAAGCVPMLIQFPIFIILYDVIRGLTNTVTRGGVTTTGQRCAKALCSVPRYIGHGTALYQNVVSHPGVMKAFGVNLANDLFSHMPGVDRIPYAAMILIAVGLQYFQMHQMNKRNAASGAVNQQMQAMTKFMPLIFIVIYVRIAAGVNVYFIISNLCRIGLQLYSFRSVPAVEAVRVGTLAAPAAAPKPRRRTLMDRLVEAQKQALEQQARQRAGNAAPPELGRGGTSSTGPAAGGARRAGPGPSGPRRQPRPAVAGPADDGGEGRSAAAGPKPGGAKPAGAKKGGARRPPAQGQAAQRQAAQGQAAQGQGNQAKGTQGQGANRPAGAGGGSPGRPGAGSNGNGRGPRAGSNGAGRPTTDGGSTSDPAAPRGSGGPSPDGDDKIREG